ncbi:MAG: DUF2726 domain-containing protein [Pseudomonadota bacterium]
MKFELAPGVGRLDLKGDGDLVIWSVIGVFVLLILIARRFKARRPRWKRRDRRTAANPDLARLMRRPARIGGPTPPRRSMADPAAQLAVVSQVGFERWPLLNQSERRLFRFVERCLAPWPDYRVMAQVSLGEVIRPRAQGDDDRRRDAMASVNSKRIDIAVIDPEGLLALAIEYQGSGHHRDGAFLRDAVKREALRRAGVTMLEVETGAAPAVTRLRLLEALRLPAVGAQDAADAGRQAGPRSGEREPGRAPSMSAPDGSG